MLDLAALDKLAVATSTSVDDVTTAVRDAIGAAYRATPGTDPARHVVIAPGGALTLDDGAPLPTGFDRAAAATARAAMLEWVHAARRAVAAGPWAGTENTAVTGTVTGTTRRGETTVRLHGATGVMPAGEAVPGEQLTAGSSAWFLVLAVNVDDRGRPKITLSRRQPTLAWALATTQNRNLPAPTQQLREPGTTTKVVTAPEHAALARAALDAPWLRAALGTGESVHVLEHHPADLESGVRAALPEGTIRAVTVTDPTRREVTLSVDPDQVHAVRGPGGVHLAHAKKVTGARLSIQVAAP